ncbi:MAG: S-methyl-5-thioribose-1-phosphate isomerase [Methanobacteriota archaeon]|nr:MAG: S-methyl-5-thioribose-1-phosphate isomerase [Euryarchaeota archaeon]
MHVTIEGVPRELKTVWLEDGMVKLIDQRYLPFDVRVYEAKTYEDVAVAIEDMVVRGAPAIGATAAYGMAQAGEQGLDLKIVADRFRKTRPTGQDLFYAIDTMMAAAAGGQDLLAAAERYARDDIERCRKIGEHGAKLIRNGTRILTHCNAGALAAVDYGTAMAPMRVAKEQGRRFFVYVDETRPRLQGARLTAWELLEAGIEHAIITDGAAGLFLGRGEIDLVLVGADRIAANGDTANKIGTYGKAVVAKENGVPFYVAAPTSTIDTTLASGAKIPIEERSPQEVLHLDGHPIAPKESPARNPAFDVTPAKYITGIITERGILKPSQLRTIHETPPSAKKKPRTKKR